MAEMVELSRGFRRPNGVIGGFLAALKARLSRFVSSRRASRLRMEEWPDYLLRDIGLDRAEGDRADPRALPMDWPLR